ncbi:MAG: tRNA (N6-isopentenyl adenosine(37)-C2)-methylthiotransferase MiaB [Candidatus Omnitrophica bacterium]|nr:tRNA (N6-isopentenyl adenosine(37)-C2)-methylthiotransferase MiaB [Candidatus Omnitrophota bacterium]
MKEDKKKVFFRTFGCQMNVRDSEVIGGLLKKEGFRITEEPREADVVIFNTCSVRQHAEEKVWSEIGRFKTGGRRAASHKVETKPIIGLCGCMAQYHKEGAFERSALIDFVVGPSDIDKIPGIIKKLAGRGIYESKFWETEGTGRPEEVYHTGFYADKEHAYVVISEGCSNYCSYCIVPYVRGEIRHRAQGDILQEIEEAVQKGIKNITLLGQNVNAYRHGEAGFIGLLKSVDSIKGLKSFSFVTSHPKDTSVELFQAMRDCQKLKKYLHLAVQSGSDRILKLMNRGYDRKFYLDLADKYRKIVKDAVLTTDIIVGFPGETKEDFDDTRDLVDKIKFNAAFIFKYSPRPGTAAFRLPDDVPDGEKKKRHAAILNLQKRISKTFPRTYIKDKDEE